MKKETKRYSILEYNGKTLRTVKTEHEYNEFVKYIKKVNSRITSRFYFGNLSKEKTDNGYKIEIHIYNRLTMPRTISDIDSECAKYRSQKDMLESGYKSTVRHENPDMYIGYFETINKKDKGLDDTDVRIKPLPLMFECDQKFFEESYIKKCFIYHANEMDIPFFKLLCNEVCLDHNVTNDIIKLRATIEDVLHKGISPFNLSVDAYSLFNKYTYERENNRVVRDENGVCVRSHRRVRDIGSFIRDYGMKNNKKLSATRYNVAQSPKDMGTCPSEEDMEIKYVR